MKHLKSILYQLIYPTCALAVALLALFMVILFTTNTSYAQPGLTPQGFGLILLFSFLTVLTTRIFSLKLHLGLRVTIHFIACTLTFVISFIFLGGYYADHGATSLLITLLFALIYFLICIPILLIRRHVLAKKNDSKTYHSILSSKQ